MSSIYKNSGLYRGSLPQSAHRVVGSHPPIVLPRQTDHFRILANKTQGGPGYPLPADAA